MRASGGWHCAAAFAVVAAIAVGVLLERETRATRLVRRIAALHHGDPRDRVLATLGIGRDEFTSGGNSWTEVWRARVVGRDLVIVFNSSGAEDSPWTLDTLAFGDALVCASTSSP